MFGTTFGTSLTEKVRNVYVNMKRSWAENHGWRGDYEDATKVECGTPVLRGGTKRI